MGPDRRNDEARRVPGDPAHDGRIPADEAGERPADRRADTAGAEPRRLRPKDGSVNAIDARIATDGPPEGDWRDTRAAAGPADGPNGASGTRNTRWGRAARGIAARTALTAASGAVASADDAIRRGADQGSTMGDGPEGQAAQQGGSATTDYAGPSGAASARLRKGVRRAIASRLSKGRLGRSGGQGPDYEAAEAARPPATEAPSPTHPRDNGVRWTADEVSGDRTAARTRRVAATGATERIGRKAARGLAGRADLRGGVAGRMARLAPTSPATDAHSRHMRAARGARDAAAYETAMGRPHAHATLAARIAAWVARAMGGPAPGRLAGRLLWLAPVITGALLVASCAAMPAVTESQSEPEVGLTWDVAHAYSVWFCQETLPWGRYREGEAYDYAPWDTSGPVAMTMAIDIVTDANITPAQYFNARRNAGLWHSSTTDWASRSDTGRQDSSIKGHDADPAFNDFHAQFDVRTERISRSLDSIRAALSRGQVVVLGSANGNGLDPWLVNADDSGDPSFGRTAREGDQHAGYHHIVIWKYEKGCFLTKHSGAVGRRANNVPYTDAQMQRLLDSCGSGYEWLADAVYAVGNTYTGYPTAVGAQAQVVVDAAYAALNSTSRYRLYGDPFANGRTISEIGFDGGGKLRLADTDCGGLVNFCYTQAGVSGVYGLGTGWYEGKSLPDGFVEIPVAQMQPGDIMWWPGSHVAIYVGDDKSIEHRDSGHAYGGWVQLVEGASERAPRALHYTPFDAQGGAAVSGAAARVIQAARVTTSPGAGLCAMWVSMVFANAGHEYCGGNANDMYWSYCNISDLSAIKPGMVVAVATHPHTAAGRQYGHIGIYIGGGQVVDNVGYIRTMGLQEWADRYGNGADGGEVRCGWLMGTDLSRGGFGSMPASAAWFLTDSWYAVAMQRKAALYGSETDWLATVDCDLCRVMWLHREGGSWVPAAGWNSIQGTKNNFGWHGTRCQSFRGAWRIDHKTSTCTCYVVCIRADGTDICQRFEPSNWGNPDDMPLHMRWQSHGCTNLEESKAMWIHDNIPIGTTVIVFDSKNPTPAWYEWDYAKD